MQLMYCVVNQLNEFQENLYEKLNVLVLSNEAFYYKDEILDNKRYMMFNYRVASYTDFLSDGALECRGIMFEIDEDERPKSLVSMPMHKFFNIHENPFTIGIDLNDIESISVKSDGSLISTFLHNGKVALKTKMSLSSEQAIAATEWLNLPENNKLKQLLQIYCEVGYTVNMEWVSPNNRIVVGYDTPRLIVLNIRFNTDGSYLKINKLNDIVQYMEHDVVVKNKKLFVENIPHMDGNIEGFVVKLKSGLWFKSKTERYMSLHQCKDNMNQPRGIYNVILDGGIDDIKSLFHYDRLLMKQINEMENKVYTLYNTMVISVDAFYFVNKGLTQKDYAIKAQKEVDPLYFSLVMNAYIGRKNDYKEWMKKKYENFSKMFKKDLTE